MQDFKRVKEWEEFSDKVKSHVADYTIPQYGDLGTDRCTTLTPKEMMNDIGRYVARFGNSRRGPMEQHRDLLKIAHYAAIVYGKLTHDDRTL